MFSVKQKYGKIKYHSPHRKEALFYWAPQLMFILLAVGKMELTL